MQVQDDQQREANVESTSLWSQRSVTSLGSKTCSQRYWSCRSVCCQCGIGETIAAELPRNVYLLRNKSMWLNTKLFLDVLKLLKEIINHYEIQHTYQVMLFVDAFGGHISIPSFAMMKDCRFWFVSLPANLTYLLQPLDVKPFRMVKRFLSPKLLLSYRPN